MYKQKALSGELLVTDLEACEEMGFVFLRASCHSNRNGIVVHFESSLCGRSVMNPNATMFIAMENQTVPSTISTKYGNRYCCNDQSLEAFRLQSSIAAPPTFHESNSLERPNIVQSELDHHIHCLELVHDESHSPGLLSAEETKECPPRVIHRSASDTRRVNESIQFLTAVGEDPSSLSTLNQSQYQIQILDDEHSIEMDDEDENAIEIRATKVPHFPPTTSVSPSKNGGSDVAGNNATRIPPFRIRSMVPYHLQERCFSNNLDYKGIGDEGLQRMRRGTERGNYSQLHRKAWLEVSDPKHRYGKNLRLYYRHWESLGHPTNNFFDWLDGTGGARCDPLPNLPECPRSKLDTDTVLYITDDEIARGYTLQVKPSSYDGRGQILDVEGNPVWTGSDGWIFVLRDNVLYGSLKVTAVCDDSKQRFHHSSFFGGKAVTGAGIIVTDEDGFLTHMYPHSGHYRPREPDIHRVLCYLHAEGVDLGTLEIDMQQVMQVCRHDIKSSATTKKSGDEAVASFAKKTKMRTLYLHNALDATYFLSHKAQCIEEGLFADLERRREGPDPPQS